MQDDVVLAKPLGKDSIIIAQRERRERVWFGSPGSKWVVRIGARYTQEMFGVAVVWLQFIVA